MKNCILFFLCVVFSAESISQQKVNTTIDAVLNDRKHTIDGHISIEYINRSTDTLHYIWMQVWPNAFKNDQTAYSERRLEEGKTDFYFSDKKQKGYINRLDFTSGGSSLKQEDHPKHIDIIKIYLDTALSPGNSVTLTTPFHVQLPYNFSGLGHIGKNYALQYWYPTPAVYNSSGWHPEPFTNDTLVHTESGDFDVRITLPVKYDVFVNAAVKDSVKTDSLKTVHFIKKDAHDFLLIGTNASVLYYPPRGVFNRSLESHSRLVTMQELLSKKFLPVPGYNRYDGIQLGVFWNGITNSEKKIRYYASPMYAFSSKRITGMAGVHYVGKEGYFDKIEVGVDGAAFSTRHGNDSIGKSVFGDMYKVSPFIRVTLPSTGKIEKSAEFRTYIIGERDLQYNMYSADSLYYPSRGETTIRYLNQLTFNYSSSRVLYPYSAQLQVQQAKSFYRLNATGKYFFNYPKGGGMNVRLFAAKFGYIGAATSSKKFETARYQPKLTALRGSEDYTYGDYFFGRNEFEGINGQQIMMRDGGLKLRTDLFQDLQGRSDNWIASMNINTTIFNNNSVVRPPFRLFLDVGTYSGAWKKESSSARFLYVAGLQLSLFKELLNIYAPLLYSTEFRNNLKTVPEENTFFKRISFNIDVSRITRNFGNKTIR